MEKYFKLSMVLLVSFLMATSSVLAVPFDSEWEEYLGDPLGEPTWTVNDGPAYFIWADDAHRRQWSIRWVSDGPGSTDLDYFSGTIAMSDNSFNVTSLSFENHGGPSDGATLFDKDGNTLFIEDGVETTLNGIISISPFTAAANTSWDGFDLEIIGSVLPSFIGFDLWIGPENAIKDSIFIGSAMGNPASQDFKIAAPAPVPEPATLLLLGSGLIGLASLGRKKIKN